MQAVKARFDGKNIKFPKKLARSRPGDVVVIFQDPPAKTADATLWLKAQEAAFAAVWDNDEDAIYDSL